jgi:hypothetical protein
MRDCISSKSRCVQNEQDVNLWGHVECFIRGHKSLHLHSERGSRCKVYYIRSHCQIQMVIGQYLLPCVSTFTSHSSTAMVYKCGQWLSSNSAILVVVNDMWVAKLQEAENSWFLKGSSRVVEVIKFLLHLKCTVDRSSPLLLQSFDFSALCTKINVWERWKARLKVLYTKVFDRNTWSLSFQFSVGPEVSTFDFKFILFEDRD